MAIHKFNGEAEWHALRQSHVGGSEVAALFNRWRYPDGTEAIHHLYEATPEGSMLLESCSPYTTGYRLYMEKAGLLPPDFEANERMMAGNFMEPAIAMFGQAKWSDWKLHKSRVYHSHPIIEGWGASLDYFVSNEPGRPPVDVKNVDRFIFDKTWAAEGGDVVGMPLHINLQLQHQIGATMTGAGGVANGAWILACVGGNALYRGYVERHDPTILRIAEAVTVFWTNVHAGNPPPDADYATVAEVFADGGGDPLKPLALETDEAFNRTCRRFMRWSAHAKFVEGQMKLIKGRIANAMGESPKALGDGIRVSWPVIQREAKHVSYDLAAGTYRGGLTVSNLPAPKPAKEKA